MCTQATEETVYLPALVKANGKCVHHNTSVCRLCCYPIIISDLDVETEAWRGVVLSITSTKRHRHFFQRAV